MKKHLPKYKLLIVPIAKPLLIGIYKNNTLIETLTSAEKTSDILLILINQCLEKYNISQIIYTRGPGSYMAIKLTYIILKTIEIVKDIECKACSAFELNDSKPIKAIGNLYFIKEKETIITKKFEQSIAVEFTLPQTIHDLILDEESTPEYMLAAV